MAPVARFSGRLRGSSLFDPFALDMWSPFEGSPRSGGGGGAGTTFSAGPGPDARGPALRSGYGDCQGELRRPATSSRESLLSGEGCLLAERGDGRSSSGLLDDVRMNLVYF
ncbi:unnamed protein product [Spirodela intermedia]|uniref:Uncharacterized protein n=1 Tax=Spirodela intermedia TaxID=51605 RepID=A0A7I8JSF1_SPIIN|nr:unnamed protein product [Spirodela intermedia]CAA6672352.1 unnamed protein product [Spirodela intermedia]